MANEWKPMTIADMAKELNIPTYELIAKCLEEKIPFVEEDDSPVSVGLAEVIREWYAKPEKQDWSKWEKK